MCLILGENNASFLFLLKCLLKGTVPHRCAVPSAFPLNFLLPPQKISEDLAVTAKKTKQQ